MILHELVNYDTLRLIWWALIGVLLVGFAVTDGFDLGTGILLPFAARSDVERRVVINSVGPVWEGNQVWLILGGGAVFAAWPQLYAVSFSGFYLAMFVILTALILRPVAFKFRSKREEPAWRARWASTSSTPVRATARTCPTCPRTSSGARGGSMPASGTWATSPHPTSDIATAARHS